MDNSNTIKLSEKELSARLNKETINHPVTLSLGVVGLLSGVAGVLFSSSELFMVIVGVSFFTLTGCLFFVLNRSVIGKHKAMLKIIEQLRTETRTKREQMSESIKTGLIKFKKSNALHQLNQLKEKFETFNSVLNLQFDNDEMTHGRYLTTAEQLYLGAVDNLRSYMILCHSISAIDIKHIERQLKKKELPEDTKNTLSQRLAIYQSTAEEMDDILAANEQVMTKIDEVTSSLGSIQTREGLGEVRLNTAMQEIQVLINRTEKYDISNNRK
ncbi:hypothetical protein [Photobacterium angustum]|uniref:hypothetical protein n=1 Tax=Photobacterium angustum TaxID=661 RepID=UPI0005E2D6C1|nr:hypothetical protein [Photobacterium angustum]KJG01976.1 hypothetical protein UB35_10335 [Photobacterium angustum]KJG16946.1 hypothetical protein UA33_11645 [Photobacterium angustum]KJG24234.1 hypothetical protein UA39_08710 [Photobacterium angustum]KJG31837.1 hypothetical protein UA36_08845 [Photobacterium angustum]PSV69644.1 hypothetical protein CTM95_01215 [Photobacterium angustum]